MIPLSGVVADLPNDDYHADTTHLSSSTLKRLLPDYYGPPPTDPNALDFGTAFHTRTFGTDERIVVVDAATWRSKAAEAERAAIKADGAVPILAADSAMVDAMVARVRSHPMAGPLLRQAGARAEVSAFAVDDDGLPIKARFDLLAPIAVDLKSTSADPYSTRDLTGAVVRYGYDLSVAHYLDVADLLNLAVSAFALLFVGKKPPHAVRVVELDHTFLARGRALIDLAKHRHRHGVTEHVGTEKPLTLAAPAWAPHPEGIPA